MSVAGPRGAGKTSLIAYCCQHADVGDVVDRPALDAFGRMYVNEDANLRRTLAAMTMSVEHAADVGAERVGEAQARFGIQSGA